jgi:hypothetical protein
MSLYSDFLYDLPFRLKELLKRHFEFEKGFDHSYEITLLLSLSFPLFNFSYEVIKCASNYKGIYEKNAKDLKKSLNEIVSNDVTGIFKNVSDKWMYGVNLGNANQFQIEKINFPTSLINNNENKILDIFDQLRNSISHASVKFKENDSNEIISIMFISRLYEFKESVINRKTSNLEIIIKETKNIKTGYHIHEIPVEDFLKFINQLCTFLINHEASAIVIGMKNKEQNETRA